jgi:hypothetical protein
MHVVTDACVADGTNRGENSRAEGRWTAVPVP